ELGARAQTNGTAERGFGTGRRMPVRGGSRRSQPGRIGVRYGNRPGGGNGATAAEEIAPSSFSRDAERSALANALRSASRLNEEGRSPGEASGPGGSPGKEWG